MRNERDITRSPLLFVVTSAASYRLQRIFAEYCVGQGRSVAFVYDQPPDTLYSQIEIDAAQLSAFVVALDTVVCETDQPVLRWGRMPRVIRAWVFSLLASPDRSAHRRILGARLSAAQRLLQDLSPSVVIVSEDGISGPAAIIAAARSLELPVIDLPYGCGIQQDLEIALEEKDSHGELIRVEGWLGRLVAMLAPAWVKKGRFSGALIFPPGYIAAREALGMTLLNGWIVHGGYADRLLVESDQMMDLYRSEGIPEEKLVLTGTPYCDVVFSTLKQDSLAAATFRKPMLIEPGKVRILVSWPPSYHASRAAKCEFQTYEEMSREILGWLNCLPGCTVTVSIHPAIQGGMREHLDQLGLNISDEYVVALIPKHDIFVTYYSSTIRWAIASGKPVVNYDAYRLKLNLFRDAPGYFDTSTFTEFKHELTRLISSVAAFEQCAAQQIAIAERWGLVDGGCMSRMLDELDRISSS